MSNQIEKIDDFLFAEEEDDLLFFEEEDEDEGDSEDHNDCWKIIVVDDEAEVHRVTELVLKGLVFDDKKIAFLHAYSSKDAMELIRDNPDTAIILLDVVMEADDAGLRVIRYIRERLKNRATRIILRTGQPGQAPEKRIIMDYDINDYKEKTELTSQKLFTTIIASLRSYRDINIIEINKRGLEDIITSSADIFKPQSIGKFASGVLMQLTSLLRLHKNALHCNSFAVTRGQEDIFILAATGDYADFKEKRLSDAVPPNILHTIENAFRERKSEFNENHMVVYFKGNAGADNVIYLQGVKKLTDWERNLIEIYCTNVSVAFENIYLNEEIESTQREIIFTMGEIAEIRSHETAFHVKRVAEYSKLLALKYGLSEEEAELVRLASPMHDIGKVGIPDSILNKPGKLDEQEIEIMRNHTKMGYDLLKHSNRKIMSAAAIIAQQHHEKYNGTGYPNGLKKEEIHLYGRITAVADVFDALASERVYKKSWELENIIALFNEERGEHFDPHLVDLFLRNLEEFLVIKEAYSDFNIMNDNDD